MTTMINKAIIKAGKIFGFKIAKKNYKENRTLKIEPGYEKKYILRKNNKVHLNLFGCGTLMCKN